MPDNEKNEGSATIEGITTDQGSGASFCSACGTTIDIQRLPEKRPGELHPRCPNPECDRQLTFGGMWISPGGSDF